MSEQYKEEPLHPPGPRRCRVCSGTEFYTKEVTANGGDGPTLLPLGFFTASKFQIYICGRCGLVEWFVSEKYLPAVKKKFDRMLP
ncbi:MAG: hypothetical protein H0T73_19900 [Ardenticatenales bacterium]|nr:hypothetical protein [Ardenticatenales bacterium]